MISRAFFVLLSLALPLCLLLAGCGAPANVPHSDHVVVVMEENHSFEQVFVQHQMPWLEQQAAKNGMATAYFANAHFSLPNYFWLTAGQAVSFDDNTRQKFDVDNITNYLEANHLTWKEYAERIPRTGYVAYNTHGYVERHDPFAYYENVEDTPLKKNIVPFSNFAKDRHAGALPNFSFISPGLRHDAHNGTLQAADAWLQQNIAPLLDSPEFKPGGNGVLLVVFDESVDSDCRPNPSCGPEPGNVGGGRVAFVMIGPTVRPGVVSNRFYMHQNVLRTVLDMLGIQGGPGASANAQTMNDFF